MEERNSTSISRPPMQHVFNAPQHFDVTEEPSATQTMATQVTENVAPDISSAMPTTGNIAQITSPTMTNPGINQRMYLTSHSYSTSMLEQGESSTLKKMEKRNSASISKPPMQHVFNTPQHVDLTEEPSATRTMATQVMENVTPDISSAMPITGNIPKTTSPTMTNPGTNQRMYLTSNSYSTSMLEKGKISTLKRSEKEILQVFLELLRVTWQQSFPGDSNLSVGRQNWDMNFKDVASAAQTTVVSAERAHLTASVGVELLRITRQFSSESQRSRVQSSGGGGPIHATGSTNTGKIIFSISYLGHCSRNSIKFRVTGGEY
ncbi:hypothetical protein A4A49_52404 [Nicotiana attenuata]|uniref:Uncharacterized protein n=1 Tax=Nicotiana attenuata TaxID=49451 RepID=A0A1J6IUZ0_NICAT|nr:hypothetical protein A4A49_52404 [Nicotiana attenuata]